MPNPIDNPFNKKQFYIYDSVKNTGCTSTASIIKNAKITSVPSNINANSKNPMSAIEVQTYIYKLIGDFTKDASFAKKCDTQSRYNDNAAQPTIDPSCGQVFSNDFTKTSTTAPKLSLNNFIFNTSINKKPLCQQFNDISGLVVDFSNVVLKNINSYDVQDITTIKQNYNNITTLRNKLDLQLNDLLNNDLATSKLQLDSTVYTTVLWTVLATSVLYYVFIKI